MSGLTRPAEWPALSYVDWAAAQKTLQLYTQIAGKVRLALERPRPQWVGSSLLLTAHGLTTSTMPYGTMSVEIVFDFYDDSISILTSERGTRSIALAPARCVADVYAELMRGLKELGIQVEIWTKPQEVEDTTPLDQNRHDCTYEADKVRNFFRVLTAVAGVFDEWHARFFGRTSVQFWWGSFDLSLLAFNGKPAVPPPGVNYIMRYDLDAEHMAAGFWPGGEASPDPILYAYIVPQPPGCSAASIQPESAAWSEEMGEWVLPYESVRRSANPRLEILRFLNSVYELAGSLGGWDLKSYEYSPPPVEERLRSAIGR